MRAAIVAFLIAPAVSATAGEFVLSQPIDCVIGESCHIQQYVDHQPGPDAQDFMCNALTYDGHKGTDFGLPSTKAMTDGVRVLAAADGRVIARRDGMSDAGLTPATESQIDGRECGNGVVLGHGDGWETQYCHMKQGSVRVTVGQSVTAGEALGLVGLSGKTEFPHVHLSVRRDGAVIDPFAPDMPDTCGASISTPLWKEALPYQPGGLLAVGFADDVPTYDSIKDGAAAQDTVTATTAGIVLWGYAFGGRRGDIMRLAIEGPAGRLIDQQVTLENARAQFFRAAGKRLTSDEWPLGGYTGRVELWRGDRIIDRRTVALKVR